MQTKTNRKKALQRRAQSERHVPANHRIAPSSALLSSTTPTPRKTPIPEVFVLWHPRCEIGEKLAQTIYAWLRPGHGLGPQVFYRSTKAVDAPVTGCLPFPLPNENRFAGAEAVNCKSISRVTNVQLILPLIDGNMVADSAWREWLVRLGGPSSTLERRVFPVALDATAFNVPRPVRDLNFLRPSGLPLPTVTDPAQAAQALEPVVRSLLKQLTETLCTFMLTDPDANRSTGDESVPKLKVFLSHAKRDGALQARRLRDYIYSQTQLAAFFDENDIAFGSVFSRVLETDLGARETAALIAIRSALYASRPWCRRELSVFRRPHLEFKAPNNGGERWRLYPTLVVDAIEAGKQTDGIPELGNAPCLRWDDSPNQEERIITTVLRDVMLAAFHSAIAASLPLKRDDIILNWIPDPITLLQIERIRAGQAELTIIHPGRGLSWLELDTMAEIFPRLTFRSFEEVLSS